MTRSRETILARVWQNPPTSRRFIARPPLNYVYFEKPETFCVYDQVAQCYVPDDEIERIDPDELMRLP